MRDNITELIAGLQIAEMINKKDECQKKFVFVLAIIGAIVAIAGIAYGVYRYMTPDYLEDFDDDFDENFDEDFYEDLEKEEAEEETEEAAEEAEDEDEEEADEE